MKLIQLHGFVCLGNNKEKDTLIFLLFSTLLTLLWGSMLTAGIACVLPNLPFWLLLELASLKLTFLMDRLHWGEHSNCLCVFSQLSMGDVQMCPRVSRYIVAFLHDVKCAFCMIIHFHKFRTFSSVYVKHTYTCMETHAHTHTLSFSWIFLSTRSLAVASVVGWW